MKDSSICVVGLGYIGLPTACMFASSGVRVLGVDIDQSVIGTLKSGSVHIVEKGLEDLFAKATRESLLTFSLAPHPADAFIIAVPTPFMAEKRADLRYVVSAAESIVPNLRPGNLVVLESTSPPRTTADVLVPILERSGLRAGVDFHVAYSPERVLPGCILKELVENDRVIGGLNTASAAAARELYAAFVRGEIVLTDSTTAEVVKLMENTYRDVNIAVANEFAKLADRFELDVWEAIAIANRHPRVNILNPGAGVGGHCISVDPWFLVEAAPDLTRVVAAARQTNDEQPHFVVDVMRKSCGMLAGKRIAALGLAYKPDVDDLRESPAIVVVKLLLEAGARVTCYEPLKTDAAIPGLTLVPTLADAIAHADIILLLVGHSEFSKLSAEELSQLTRARTLIDTANAWVGAAWRECGFRVVRLGVGRRSAQP
jgi:UDP-N-acetyl-D-mannosaminuronic acid dehydrogenase